MSTPGDTSATFCATLVDEWIHQGVRHAVVAPGSRSTPLAVALTRRPELSIHVFHDERTAAFAALGIGVETGFPAVLLCTSGTAATHFHAAVAEADLSNVPMIVCTADRPPELRDVGAPQTIRQTDMYGTKVRWFHDPGVPSDEARDSWRSLASRLVASAITHRPGPVHVNLPFREPLLGTPTSLPEGRSSGWARTQSKIVVPAVVVSECAQRMSGRRGIIVAGRGATPATLELATALGWPILADARSGLRMGHSACVMAFDAILRSQEFASNHRPEVVLRVGEPPASKVTNQWIASCGAEVMQVQPYGNVTDPDHLVSVHLIGDVDSTLLGLAASVARVESSWLSDWAEAERTTQAVLDAWSSEHDSEITNARAVTKSLSSGDRFVVSSSMPIRDVEWFGSVTTDVHVHSNRGANGIDGVISTAVGVALASGKKTVVYIGDVAAVHDANALLALMSRNAEVKVVVSNNDGGSIFSFLPQAALVDTHTFETLYGTPHGVSFAHLAKAFGVPYVLTSATELPKLIRESGSAVIELSTQRNVNVSQHAQVNDAVTAAIDALHL